MWLGGLIHDVLLVGHLAAAERLVDYRFMVGSVRGVRLSSSAVGDVCRACMSAGGGLVCGHADEGQGPAGVG